MCKKLYVKSVEIIQFICYDIFCGDRIMSKFVKTAFIICEKCKKQFKKEQFIYNVINLDFYSTFKNDFFEEKINNVRCPYCDTKFTFETEFLAYSPQKEFAIFAIPKNNDRVLMHGNKNFCQAFGTKITTTRLVHYMCEVLEKVKIFNSGLNDIKIEKIKLTYFDESLFADRDNYILLFDKITDDELIFYYKNYLGQIIDIYSIPIEIYNTININEIPYSDTHKIAWHRVDINYFKEK